MFLVVMTKRCSYMGCPAQYKKTLYSNAEIVTIIFALNYIYDKLKSMAVHFNFT